MRALAFWFGPGRRSDPIALDDLHAIPKYEDAQDTGSPPHDGYSLLSKSDPKAQGNPPPVEGTIGQVRRGPNASFER
jgi:hypothetical protein